MADFEAPRASRAAAVAEWLARAAFAWLVEKKVIPADTPTRDLQLTNEELVPATDWMAVAIGIGIAYGLNSQWGRAVSRFLEAQALMSDAFPHPTPSGDGIKRKEDVPAHLELAHVEFTRPYIAGNLALEQLKTYIGSCATTSATHAQVYQYPYISIVQSSGFGKSRLLRELANTTKDDETATMRVLYTCLRPRSKFGYPKSTFHLRNYLFPVGVDRSERENVHGLAARLYGLFDYALANWEAIGTDWFSLFSDETSDETACKKIEDHIVDDTTAVHRLSASRTVVLAIDEARYLLQRDDGSPSEWFHWFRSALEAASLRIRTRFGEFGWIFAVLVDTNAKVANFVPPVVQDRSSEGPDGQSVLYPPFVLTHTMDVRFDALKIAAKRDGRTTIAFYQSMIHRNYDDAWSALVTMGRPLWDRLKLENRREKELPTNIIQLAADKLLGGMSASDSSNFVESSLFGVASVLCRVGLGPNSWSPVASRPIADVMAVLLYSNLSHTQLLSTYSSDPVLTFGAARVWYQSASVEDVHSTLARSILPQFRKLVRQDVVDTGAVGQFVSRIILLLAMDTTGAVLSAASKAREYAGEFHSVKVFLNVLYGPRNDKDEYVVLDIFRERMEGDRKVKTILNSMGDWKVGFSHFVQVSRQPDEEMLWAMLARRAAGIFPRNFKGLDLFIPIFRGKTVSMILIQVKNHAATDPSFPESASVSMRPSSVFTNDFQHLSPNGVVRIYMSLRGPAPTARNQFYLVDNLVRSDSRHARPPEDSYVLCLEGVDAWAAVRVGVGGGSGSDRKVPVMSSAVAAELRLLLKPWWDVTEIVEEDLGSKSDTQYVGVGKDMARAIASRPLVSSLLSGWQTGAPSTLGKPETSTGARPAAEGGTHPRPPEGAG